MTNPNIFQSQETIQYIKGWDDLMVQIWQERIGKLGIIDTGALFRSVSKTSSIGAVTMLGYTFLKYGIYQETGGGRGYTRGNDGNLRFKEYDYRKQHKLGATRTKRAWFTPSWERSIFNMNQYLTQQIGDAFYGVFSELELK